MTKEEINKILEEFKEKFSPEDAHYIYDIQSFFKEKLELAERETERKFIEKVDAHLQKLGWDQEDIQEFMWPLEN